MKKKLRSVLFGILCAFASAAHAKVGGAEASALGKSLTPVGATEAGNAAGTIPAWNGGMTKLGPMFSNYKAGSGDYYPDPFPEEKPLFTITAANAAKYADQLPVGAVKRLELNPKLFYNVYPSHRTVVFPEAVYAASKANAVSAELVGDDEVRAAKLGVPFPIPGNGAEVIVNHRFRYRGDSVLGTGTTIVVGRNGDFDVTATQVSVMFVYGNVNKPAADGNDMLLQLVARTTAPPRLAGAVTLVWDKLDGSRDAWQYFPGTARVRQAPSVAFDNPISGTDGIQNVDQADMFNGSQRLYTWKLVGKKEMFIPYNNYALVRPELKIKDLIMPGHLNPKHLRYELHRVWVVDAELKPGQGNVFKKRRFYIDEDSWSIAAVDCYDARGTLWKYQEGFITPLVVDKAVLAAPSLIYDLFSGRYVVNGLPNEMGFIAKFGASFSPNYFTPQALKNLGRT